MTFFLPYGSRVFNADWPRANQGGVSQFAENFIDEDSKWNRTLFDEEKARILMELFQKMQPCIKKCILDKYSRPEEMACDYCRVYLECRHIIMKNMKEYNYPPSMFSAAVHTYIMHQGLNSNPMWRIICAVFEYTSMEISAMLGAQQKKQVVEQQRDVNNAARVVTHWLWPPGWTGPDGAKHPHDIMNETHTTVHASHSKLQSIEERLIEVLKAIKENKS